MSKKSETCFPKNYIAQLEMRNQKVFQWIWVISTESREAPEALKGGYLGTENG